MIFKKNKTTEIPRTKETCLEISHSDCIRCKNLYDEKDICKRCFHLIEDDEAEGCFWEARNK